MKKLKTQRSPIAYAISSILALSATTLSAQENNASGEDEAERVIVTGSLIRRTEFRDEQPVDIISAEHAAESGFKNAGDLLRSLSSVSSSPQVRASTSTEFVVDGGDAAETIGLRGLEAKRTLVLLNGRRAGPAGTRGSTSSFDFNVLPMSAIDRIEVFKDGASSLYGSDAVAGVINIITKKGDGGEVNVNVSRPQQQGGESERVNVTWGQSSDKATFRVVVDFEKQHELARGQRDFLTCGRRNIYDADTGENVDPIDPRTGRAHCFDLLWGQVWLYDYSGSNVPSSDVRTLAQYDYGGALSALPWMAANAIPNAFDAMNPNQMYAPEGWYFVRHDQQTDAIVDASHPFQDQQSLEPEVKRATLFAQGDYDFGGGMRGYAELLLNRRESKTNSYLQFWSYLYSETHAFNDDGDDLTDANGGSSQSPGWGGAVWMSPTGITNHADSGTKVEYTRAVLGLTGDWGDWYWDTSLQFSRSNGQYFNDEIYGDRIWDQNFLFEPCAGVITHADGTACQNIPWLDPEFLRGNLSPEMKAYLFTQQKGKTIYEQASLDFVASGDIVDLPAGPLGIALGVNIRYDRLDDTPGDIWLNANSWYGNAAGITRGSDTTHAVFAEARIPLVADKPFVESLELSLSSRFTDTRAGGDATTYKLGLNWAIGGGVNVRASRGTSFRAPALFELYLADQRSYVAQRQLDPCIEYDAALAEGAITQRIHDNCEAEGLPGDFTGGSISATVITGGGKGFLEPETSVAKTVGVVWNAPDIDLSLSLDYFDFLIENEVRALDAADIVYQCYDSAYFPNDPLCDLFERQGPGSTIPDNRIEPVHATFINIAQQINRGIDFRMAYATELALGELMLETNHTWQRKKSEELFPGIYEDQNGQFGHPKHTATYLAALKSGDWTYTWNAQYFAAVSNIESNGGDTIDYYGNDVRMKLTSESVIYHNLSVTRVFDGSGWTATVGVTNVADKRPPKVTTYRSDIDRVGDSAFYSQYDFFGRSYFADVSYKF